MGSIGRRSWSFFGPVFAWIYVNFHVWTAEIPISATGVWVPKGVLTLTTPGFYMLSLYIYIIYIYINMCVCVSRFPCETYTDSISSYSPDFTRKMDPPTIKDLLHGDLESPWWALFHESSWIIMNHLQMVDFPLACLITHGAITKSLVFIMGEVPFLGSVPPGGGRCCGSQCSVG